MLRHNTININLNDLTYNKNNNKSNINSNNNNNKLLNKKGSHNFSKQIFQFDTSNLNGPLSLANLDSSNFSSSLSHFDVSNSNSINKMGNLQTQGGGHAGILQGRKGKYYTIAKPLNSEREGQFYKTIKNSPLYQCVPKFFGMKKEYYINNNNDIKQNKPKYWLLLQDLTANMTSPCIADLKIGTRTYEINVPLSKQERQKSLLKGTTTLSHAVRCIDISIRKNNEVMQSWNRKVGRKMSWPDFQKALAIFLSSKQRVQQFKDQLKFLREKLVETYNVLPNMRLYSASVLVVYDGDKENGQLFVKLIDFGHGYTDLASEGGNIHDPACDDNALLGIDNLLLAADSFLQNIQ